MRNLERIDINVAIKSCLISQVAQKLFLSGFVHSVDRILSCCLGVRKEINLPLNTKVG